MLRKILALSIAVLSVAAIAREFSPLTLDHVARAERRNDGNFDVTCVDGSTEVRTQDELMANQACMSLRTVSSLYKLISGGTDQEGMRFCDIDVSFIRNNDRIVTLNAQFRPPCDALLGSAQNCTGKICAVQMGAHAYTFDFETHPNLHITRTSDNVTGEFAGPSFQSTRVRLETVNGIANILQASNDNGANWKSVCDDGFSRQGAEVVCRELGLTLNNFTTSVDVSGDDSFGLDDVVCNGSEESIFDCQHNSTWGNHDCGSGEHIQVTCQ